MSPPSRAATKDDERTLSGGARTPATPTSHFGPDNHIIWHQGNDDDLLLTQPHKPSDLIRAPTVRQWLHRGKLYVPFRVPETTALIADH